jgi:hypothetical protein
MWPIQLAFRLLISCRIFLCSLTLSNTSSFLTLRAVKLCEKNYVTENKPTWNMTSKLIIKKHENFSVTLYYWKNIGVLDCKL